MRLLNSIRNKVYKVEPSPSTGHKSVKVNKVYRIISTAVSKAIHYGRAEGAAEEDEGRQNRSVSRQRSTEDLSQRPPSAPSSRKPPVIRIRRERSLNGVMWGSPQQLTSDSPEQGQQTMGRKSRKRTKKPVDQLTVPREKGPAGGAMRENLLRNSPEAERFVKAAIKDVSSSSSSRPVERQVIRIISGNDPSIQCQVLLNTKTSQPWEDLVRDLGMAVKLVKRESRRVGHNYLETISGRKIQSYSQLRSELMTGTHAFYVFTKAEEFPPSPSPSRLSNSIKNSKSVDQLAARTVNVLTELGNTTNFLQVPSTKSNASTQHSSRKPKPSMIPVAKKTSIFREASSMTELTLIPTSHDAEIKGTRRRETRRKRSETSGYLASARSRSESP